MDSGAAEKGSVAGTAIKQGQRGAQAASIVMRDRGNRGLEGDAVLLHRSHAIPNPVASKICIRNFETVSSGGYAGISVL
jgi:hypothetical protein